MSGEHGTPAINEIVQTFSFSGASFLLKKYIMPSEVLESTIRNLVSRGMRDMPPQLLDFFIHFTWL